jgi:diguanylate cyclase (GGDEF)-like protein
VDGVSRPVDLEVTVGNQGTASWLDTSLAAVVRTERQVLLIRWLGILCAAPAGPLLFKGEELWGLWAVCAFAALYTLLFRFVIIPRYPRLLLNGYLTTLGDQVLSSSVVALTGGLRSEFYVVFYLVAVVSAIRFGRAKALFSIGVASVAYTAIVLAKGAPLTALATVAFRMSFGAITALFVGFVVDRARAAEKQVEAAALQARQALSEATAALTHSLELGEVLGQAARWSTTLAGARRGEITVVPPPNLEQWLWSRGSDLPRAASFEAAAGADGPVCEFPLIYGSESLGRLRLTLPAGATGLDALHHSLVETFASRCGPALTNAWTYAAMQAQALVDPTTGLPNHRRFKEFLADCEREATVLHRPLSILMLDLDMFKEFNDTFGHLAGDRALRQVGRILATAIGDLGLAARYGGDEFVAVLPGVDGQTATATAQAILDAFRRAVEQRSEGLAPPMGLSIGCATASAGDADYQTLVGRADLAMYFAKRSGGGVRTFEETDDGGPLQSLVGSIMTQLSKVDLRALEGGRSRATRSAARRGGPARTLEVVRMLLITMRGKDPKLFLHCRNVSRLCFRIARRLGLSSWEIHDVGLAGLLHDVGKICVPDAILQKPGALAPEEMAIVRTHSVQGSEILAPVPALANVAVAVRHHHEHFDGSGYPDGRRGDEIPLAARIVLVADAYDAITSDRPYRQGRSPAEAVRILRENQGTQFDPRVVATLTTLLAELNLARLHRDRAAAEVSP